MKSRNLIGIKLLEKAKHLKEQKYTIATIIKLLKLEDELHYRTAYDIIKADLNGYTKITRPSWLQDLPEVQQAPEGWYLTKGLKKDSQWQFNSN